jgi:hypothetical protein
MFRHGSKLISGLLGAGYAFETRESRRARVDDRDPNNKSIHKSRLAGHKINLNKKNGSVTQATAASQRRLNSLPSSYALLSFFARTMR